MTTDPRSNPSPDRQELSLNDAASHVLEECRTVVPGIQALFGFQLIAVFSTVFREQLSSTERLLHLVAILLVTIAIVLVMTPTALHRQTEPMAVSRRFIAISSRLLLASMAPLAVGICLEIYIVARVTLGTNIGAAIMATVSLAVFTVFWLILPRLARRH